MLKRYPLLVWVVYALGLAGGPLLTVYALMRLPFPINTCLMLLIIFSAVTLRDAIGHYGS